ncbi:uncharacterized protein LOC135820121 [Sycon ciliatum]|uniref:uncharacterized protein LOC135820121 n=1 Tax=Sycon ciliatum TaxID=27933 RepID=UPI0031F5F3CF
MTNWVAAKATRLFLLFHVLVASHPDLGKPSIVSNSAASIDSKAYRRRPQLVPRRGHYLFTRWPLSPEYPNAVTGGTTPSVGSSTGATYNVLDYGADPTAKRDSHQAIQHAINDAQQQLWNETSVAGNVEVSLAGGTYLISSSLWFQRAPRGFTAGRLSFRDGALVAGWTDTEQQKYLMQGNFYSVDIANLNLDAQHRGGCVHMFSHLQVTVTNVFFSHFSTVGLRTGTGHELLMDTCNFEEYPFRDDKYGLNHTLTGTALQVGSGDNEFWNTVIKCCKLGISTEGLNTFAALHLWPDCANFTLPSFSMVVGRSTRIWGSYMDGSGVLVTNPYQVHITDTWFKGPQGGVTVQVNGSRSDPTADSTVEDVRIWGNTFHCTTEGCPRLQTQAYQPGMNLTLQDVQIRDNYFDNNTQITGTFCEQSLIGNFTVFVLDFRDRLLFPVPICTCMVQYSFQLLDDPAHAGTIHHHILPSQGWSDLRVAVRTQPGAPVYGRVTASVDQSSCIV